MQLRLISLSRACSQFLTWPYVQASSKALIDLDATAADHFPTPSSSYKSRSVFPDAWFDLASSKAAELAKADVFEASRSEEIEKKTKNLDWETKFLILQVFKTVHGHCNVPPDYQFGGFRLGGWVATQRKEYSKHRMGLYSPIINDRRIGRLENVGFEWLENHLPSLGVTGFLVGASM